MMDDVFTCLIRGLRDSLSLQRCLILVVKSKKIRLRLIQCLVLNGLVFLGSIFIFAKILNPLLRYMLSSILIRDPSSETAIDNIQSWIEWIYFALWIVPVYVLSFILNAIWYQDIATESIKLYPSAAPVTCSTITSAVVELIFRSIFNLVFLIYLVALYRLKIIYAIHLSWLVAYNAFEYRWIHGGMAFSEKIINFEKNWIYFLAFGFPTAVVAVQFPGLIENGLISLFFPLLVMCASTAGKPPRVTLVDRPWYVAYPMGFLERARIFFVLEKVTNGIVLVVDVYNKSFRKRS